MKFSKVVFSLALALGLSMIFSEANAQNSLPANRRGDWLNAGYLRFQNLPMPVVKVNNILNYGASNNGEEQNDQNFNAVMAAIADRDPSGITKIYFPAGNYKFGKALSLSNLQNITLIGQGSNLTRLLFNLNGLDYQSCIGITNSSKIGLENFYLTRVDSIGTNEDGQLYNQGNNIAFSSSASCWVSGIESYKATSTHMMIGSSQNIEVRGCYFHECWTYGTNGHGYGVVIGGTESKRNLIENNIFSRFRHAMILSNGPSDNVYGYNYSRDPYTTEIWYNVTDWASDMCLHGHPTPEISGPRTTLFEGNIGTFMNADNAWGANDSYNTYFRNKTTYYGVRVDTNSPNQNIIGNEVDDIDGDANASYDLWNSFLINGTGHFIVGNINYDPTPDFIQTPYSADLSLYFDPQNLPPFLASNGYFPPLGSVDATHLGGGLTPAKKRWNDGGLLTVISNATTVGINERQVVNSFLLTNYPNPFNNSTVISFELLTAGNLSLAVYNQNGQIVENLINQKVQAGKHQFKFQADQLTSGVYYYKLKAGNTEIVKKMLLLK